MSKSFIDPKEKGCETLYSEDMPHNQVIENKLTIKNPLI